MWGRNNDAEPGLGSTKLRTVPQQEMALAGKQIIGIALGSEHCIALGQ